MLYNIFVLSQQEFTECLWDSLVFYNVFVDVCIDGTDLFE